MNEGLPSPDWGQWTDFNLMSWQPGLKLSQAHNEMRKIRSMQSVGIKLPAILFGKACLLP